MENDTASSEGTAAGVELRRNTGAGRIENTFEAASGTAMGLAGRGACRQGAVDTSGNPSAAPGNLMAGDDPFAECEVKELRTWKLTGRL
jgi:hypothetical protein